MKKKIILIFLVLLVALVSAANAAVAGTRIVLLPFNVISGQQGGVLGTGISAMLGHRLAQSGELVRVEGFAGQADVKSARAQAGKHKADYAVFGSVVVIGGSVSTDAALVDASSGAVLVRFAKIGKSEDEVIGHISEFAGQVNEALVARGKAGAVVAPVTPGIMKVEPRRELTSRNSWRSRKFDTPIMGLASGDVDGNKGVEFVFSDAGRVFVAAYVAGKLDIRSTIENRKGEEIIGVDVADINGNGKAEIFVSNLRKDGRRFASYILEWDGQAFVRIRTNLPWLFRAGKDYGGKRVVLTAQKHQSMGKVLDSPIFIMKWDGTNYMPAESLPLPEWVRVWGVGFGKGHGKDVCAAYGSGSRVRVFSGKEDEYVESIDQYGGSILHLKWPDPLEKDREERLYLHPRIAFHDIDGNGSAEIVAIKNKELSGHLFSLMRNYKSGRIEGLMLAENELEPVWRTRDVTGLVTDFTFVDIDGDGKEELVYAYSSSKGTFKKKVSSYIAVDFL